MNCSPTTVRKVILNLYIADIAQILYILFGGGVTMSREVVHLLIIWP